MPRWSELEPAKMNRSLARHFADPPDEFRPVPWLCYTGSLSDEQVRYAIDQVHEQGIRSFFIFPIYGMEIPYLSDEWFEVVRKSVEYCAEKGMTVWIYDDWNWPNGTCAGQLLKEHPEFNIRLFRAKWSGRVEAGKSASVRYSGEFDRAFAVDERGKHRRAKVSVAAGSGQGGGGTVEWVNSTGSDGWLKCVSRDQNQTDNVMHRGALWLGKDRARGYTDLTRSDASEAFIRMTHDRYYEVLRDHFGKTVVGFFDDEPAITGAHISEELYNAFEQRYGYRLEDRLDDLFVPGRKGGYRVRADFWRLTGDMFGGHLKRIDDWCKAHGVDSTGHFLAEESPQQEIDTKGAVWPARRHMSVPGLDLLGCQTNYEPVPSRRYLERTAAHEGAGLVLTTKIASATARYRGVPRVMVEAYGVMPYWVGPVDLTASTHWLTGLDSNLMNDNLLTLSFEGFRKRSQGGRHFTTPWWKHYGDFAELVGRCSLMATVGQVPAKVGLLYPGLTAQCLRSIGSLANEAPVSTGDAQLMIETNRITQQAAEALVRIHQDWEIVFEEIVEEGRADRGKLKVRSAAFSAVVVPAAHVLSAKVFAKLEAFAESGGLLVFVGATPSISIDEGFDVRTRVKALMALENVHRVQVGDDDTWVHFRSRLEHLLFGQADPSIRLEGIGHENILAVHRRIGTRSTFQFANMSSQPLEVRARVACGSRLELWHPDSGDRYDLETSRRGKEQVFTLELAPWEGLFVVSEDGKKAPPELAPPRRFPTGHRSLQLIRKATTPSWTMRAFPDFQWDAERHLPNMAPMRRWVRLDPGDEGRAKGWYKGHPDARWTATVEDQIPFNLDPEACPVVWIKGLFHASNPSADLGIIVDGKEFAEGYINGRRLGRPRAHTLWDAANLRFSLKGKVKKGWNVLAFRTPVSEYFHPDVVCSFFGPDIIEPVVLSGEFSVDGDAQGRTVLLPARDRLRLGPWSAQGLSGYAGTITYRQAAAFDKVDGPVWLDLGDVQCVAEVRVNGKNAGRRCWPPYLFGIDPFLTPGENLFEIEVTNSMGGILGACGWQGFAGNTIGEAPSGLLGPVRIIEAK